MYTTREGVDGNAHRGDWICSRSYLGFEVRACSYIASLELRAVSSTRSPTCFHRARDHVSMLRNGGKGGSRRRVVALQLGTVQCKRRSPDKCVILRMLTPRLQRLITILDADRTASQYVEVFPQQCNRISPTKSSSRSGRGEHWCQRPDPHRVRNWPLSSTSNAEATPDRG